MVKDQKRDFEALYQRYYPGILVFLCFLVDSLEGAEDLASLVFEKALVHYADVQTLDTAGPLLYRIYGKDYRVGVCCSSKDETRY